MTSTSTPEEETFWALVLEDRPHCASPRHGSSCGPGEAEFVVVVTCRACGRSGQALFCRTWVEQRRASRVRWICPEGHEWPSRECDAVYPIGRAI
jgi:hypothetical protein